MNLPKPRRSFSFLLVLAIIFVPGLLVTATLAANQLGYCVNAILPGGNALNARPYLLQVGADSATLRLRSTISAEATLTYVPEGGAKSTVTIPADKIQTTALTGLPMTFGPNHVAVPSHFYKAILAVHGEQKQVFAIILPNAANLRQPLAGFATTVDEIESLTGLDLFPALSETDQAILEQSRTPIPLH